MIILREPYSMKHNSLRRGRFIDLTPTTAVPPLDSAIKRQLYHTSVKLATWYIASMEEEYFEEASATLKDFFRRKASPADRKVRDVDPSKARVNTYLYNSYDGNAASAEFFKIPDLLCPITGIPRHTCTHCTGVRYIQFTLGRFIPWIHEHHGIDTAIKWMEFYGVTKINLHNNLIELLEGDASPLNFQITMPSRMFLDVPTDDYNGRPLIVHTSATDDISVTVHQPRTTTAGAFTVRPQTNIRMTNTRRVTEDEI